MPRVLAVTQHPVATQVNGLHYEFTPKHHHGPDSRDQAQWLLELRFEEEFSIFDEADVVGISIGRGDKYGVLRDRDGDLRFLGDGDEQVAKFPYRRSGNWHGYPCWVISPQAPPNRRRQQMFPPKEVYDRLNELGVISEEQRDRLKRGEHA
jgi:hypothetical protein